MAKKHGSGKPSKPNKPSKPQPPLPPSPPQPPARINQPGGWTNPYPFNSPEYNAYSEYLDEQYRRR